MEPKSVIIFTILFTTFVRTLDPWCLCVCVGGEGVVMPPNALMSSHHPSPPSSIPSYPTPYNSE